MLLTIPYPDTLPDALSMSRDEFEKVARLALAARLFEDKIISSGQAAEMAGIPRVEFLLKTRELRLTAAMPEPHELAGDIGE